MRSNPKRNNIFHANDDVKLLVRIVRENCYSRWQTYLNMLMLMGLAAICTAIGANLLGKIINVIHLREDFFSVFWLSSVMVFVFIVKGGAIYLHSVGLARISNQIVSETQRRIVNKLLQESVGYFSSLHSSEIMAHVLQGSTAFANIINMIVLTLGRDLLTVIALFCVMIWQDPLLTFMCALIAPFTILSVNQLARRARRIASQQFNNSQTIIRYLQETIHGIRVIKAFTMEKVMRNNIISRIEENSETSNKLAQIANQSTPILEMLGGIVVALVCMYCGYRVITLGDDPGRFMSFLSAFLLIFTPAKRLSRINIDLATEMEAAHRIYSLLDPTATEPDDFDLPSISITAGKIEFSNVNFAYRPDVPVLKNISFVAERGKLIALVGPSGSGKSTIMSLLMRFYVLDSGEIKIDEQNIESVSRHSLRTQIAYVGQDVFLFRGSVRENILVGKPDATVIEIENAARAALAHEFIVALPQGYETDIGEMGMKLSLGQRQRISIARAILKDAHIVLLDEATASLDSESEAAVQAALTRLCSGRTTIAIAHRLSAIRHADCIYFIEDGKIVEIGNEKDLLRQKGRYESFFKIQFSENMKSQNHDAI